MRTELARPVEGAQTFWNYEPSQPRPRIIVARWRARRTRQKPPVWKPVVPASGTGRWLMYFLYAPQGQLSTQHRFTLQRLASEDASVMIVCACPPGHPVLDELKRHCDALYWKGTDGFDFSAYAICLNELAQRAPGSDVLMFNDSVLGPFSPLTPFVEQAPWRVAGLSANALEENHLQSFALIARQVDAELLKVIAPVISTEWCYDSSESVILLQETLLARVASPHVSVGAYWYTDGSRHLDLCLNCPEQMIDAGFPLLKRSLFGKFVGRFQSIASMQALLHRLDHPAVMGFSPRKD
jgi:lipopolysaccharide biosynthesis protein